MRLTFLGAAREVTGSMLLVTTERASVLVDCGLFQGRRAESRRRNAHLPHPAVTADAAIVTHAHIDHTGNLPVLVRSAFPGDIYLTPATRDLAACMLRDAARLQEADAEYLNRKYADDPEWEPIVPLYTEEDVPPALERMVAVPYHRRFTVADGVSATFLDAGHILGSAQLVLDIDERGRQRRVVVSGDLGRAGLPIIRDPEPPPRHPDVLVMESTYGDRTHAPAERMADDLARVIDETRARGGKVVVPAFALGRTQELLVVLHRLRRDRRLPAIPVFIDSPLAIDVTSVFRMHPECFDAETRRLLDEDDLFALEGLHLTRTRDESVAINDVVGPAIIIAASGMAEGGRVLHHLRNLVEDPRNTVLVVGFMAQHTLGRRLVERRPRVKIWGVERDLRAQVVTLNAFSAHADADGLVAYASACRPGRALLVHGEDAAQAALRTRLAATGIDAYAPERGETIEL
ncbi:MAG: MBL fold metallo-hydrolase [Kofleriaceae bacterium]|nr:MAG: MBL fold metallo-hydrolase [Kofleriaceae bacterium]MBZ0237427.1 MBL fold metallo-hydrolase [Kofleriaceae bacterium]